jgi:hypothetical protein
METIKHIKLLEGYEIKLLESPFSYQFISPEGEIIFEGNDFNPSSCHAIDSYDSIFSLMGFLTLGKDDVEDEYWERHNYTKEQIQFRDYKAESLSMYSNDFEEGYILTFFEIEGNATYLVYTFDEFLGENGNYGKAFRSVIGEGIDSSLKGFTESNFQEERKNSRLTLKFNIKEIDILKRRLKEKGYKQIVEEIERILKENEEGK